MEIDRIIATPPKTEALTKAATTQLGKEEFLHLLTVQLRYQDPLNPMENTDFIAQMAQFSSLEQLQNMNQSLDRSLGSGQQLQGAFRNNLATSLVGRTVEVPAIETEWTGKEPARIGYRLDEGAISANLQILDGSSQLVREFALNPAVGRGLVEWDGTSRFDTRVPPGAYRVLVLARDASGGAVRAETMKVVTVEAVRYDATGATIWADGQALTLEDLGGVLAD